MNRFLVVLFIAITFCQAQPKIGRSNEQLLFIEAKSSLPILILDDSIVFKGNLFKQQKYLHSNYPSVIKDYIPFTIQDKTYLVYRGCGVVLEFRNDSIVRVDHSFLHRNQYFASTFTYKNEIYFFGGYGLFTYKNILTKYNSKTKEWDEVETFGTPPSPRRLAFSQIIDNDLYLFSGYEKDESNFYQNKVVAPIVWKLHLSNMRWSQVGKFDNSLVINSKDGIASSFTANNKLYLIPLMEYTNIYEIDIKNNTITTFKSKPKSVEQSYFDNSTKEVIYIHKNGDGLKSVIRSTLNQFLGKKVNQRAFILPWYRNINQSTIFFIIICVGLLIFLIYIINKEKSHFIPFNGITFQNKSSNFYFRGKPLSTLEQVEFRILNYLFQNKHRFISLNEMNHLCENEIQRDNFTTVVKRREVAFASLISKLQILTATNENDILIYRKNPDDKRIKEIKIKDNFIRVK